MAISTAQILAPAKVWSASLTLNGEAVPLAEILPKRSLGFTQKRGICTLQTVAAPGAAAGASAVVTLTLNGESTVFFTGRLAARPISDLPLSYEIGLVDSLARLSAPLDAARVWSGRSFVGAVRDLLHAAGVDDSEIASIYNPGTDYRIGQVVPITIAAGTDIAGALDSLMAFGGVGLFVLPNGQIKVADAPGWPATPDSATPVYAYGANVDEFGFMSSRRTIMGQEGVVAKFTAKGPRLPNKTIPDATFTLSGVPGSTVVESYAYCQSEACAKKIAEREIVRRNRSSTEVDVTAPLHPNLRPGDVIMFRHAELGFPTNTPAIIIGISTSDDEMTLAISVGARPADGEITVIPPPSPSFTMLYEIQPVSLAGILAIATVVQCTDTSTDPSGFGITGHAWEATCNGDVQPAPASVTWSYDASKTSAQNPVPNPVFVFPTLDGAQISLTVESSSGEGATVVHGIVPTEAERFTRSLSVAAGTQGWRILAGATGWRSFLGDAACTAVPNINDQGPLIAGFGDGKLYLSTDRLLTAPDLLTTLSAAVNCIFVNEGDPNAVLVGAGATLSRSSDGGASWAAVHTFEDAIQYCESSVSNPNEIRVCAGPNLLISYDGASFVMLLDGQPGTVCRKVASAPWGHLVVWAGTEGDVQAAEDIRSWQIEEGHDIDWSGVPVEHMPFDLASATAMQYEEGFIVAAGGPCDLVRDGLYGQLTYLANAGTVIKLYRLVTSGSGVFTASYITATTGGGPHKLINHGGVFPIDTATQAYRIGYGAALDPARPPELVVLPSSQTGAADQLAHYLPVTGWNLRSLPEPNAAWLGLDINPRNSNEWLIWNVERIYWTSNAGLAWTQIYTPSWDSFSIRNHPILGACFTGHGSEWIYSLASSDGFNNQGSSLVVGARADLIRGRLAGAAFSEWPTTTSDPYQLVTSLTRGYDGEVWARAAAPGVDIVHVDYDRQVWIDPAVLAINTVGLTPYTPGPLREPRTGRSALATWSNNVGRTPNYRTTAPTGAIAAGGSVVVCNVGILAGNRVGIAQIATIDAVPSLMVVAGGATEVGRIVAGTLGQGAGAPAASPNSDGTWTIFAHNGVQWAATTTPVMTAICPQIGVIER